VKGLKKLYFNQEGAALVLVALMLVVLMGMATLVADVGILTKSKRQLVTTADAAALAGAQELINITGQNDPQIDAKKAAARTKAKEYAEYNYPGLIVDKNTITVNYADNGEKSVTVPLVKEGIGLTFARVLGHDVGTVAASAQAAIEYPTSVITDGKSGNLLPIAVDEQRYNEIFRTNIKQTVTVVDDSIFKLANGGFGGNWGFVRIGGNGTSTVDYWLSAGLEGSIDAPVNLAIGDTIDTKPGNLGNNTPKSLDLRNNNNKPMYGVIPLVKFEEEKGGTTPAKIMNFVVFEITGYDKAFIEGVFRPDLTVSDYMGNTSSSSTSATGSRVIILTK
jgi:hypothetical protein